MSTTKPRAERKPWVIFVTNNRELGRPIRLLARPTEGRWTNGRRRAAKFKTADEAEAYLKAVDRQGGTSYRVSKL